MDWGGIVRPQSFEFCRKTGGVTASITLIVAFVCVCVGGHGAQEETKTRPSQSHFFDAGPRFRGSCMNEIHTTRAHRLAGGGKEKAGYGGGG